MKKNRLMASGLAVLTIFALAGCGSSQAADADYSLRLKYITGEKMIGDTVTIKDSEGNVVSTGKSDKYGMYKWTADSSKTYTAEVSGMPTGYYVETDLTFNPGTTYINAVVSSKLITDSTLPKNYVYDTPGEIAYDYTLTDYKDSSKTYKFSDILATKDLLVVNFFYIGCGPCASEFPVMEKAYQKYSDKVELISVDVYTSQTATQIDSYRTDTLGGITFPMAYDTSTNLEIAMDVRYVPTTAFIDRYGRIAIWTYGAETSQNAWEQKFEDFTSDDYVPTDAVWDEKDW